MPVLDDVDIHLLDELQADASRTLRELGDIVGLSPSAVQRRIGRYRDAGLVRVVAQIPVAQVPTITQALILLTLAEESRQHHRRVAQSLRQSPVVQQGFTMSGRYDYAVIVSARSIRDVRDVSTRLFKTNPNIKRYDTMFLLDVIKQGSTIPARLLR